MNQIDLKNIAPVYFLYGEERYLIDRATRQLIEATVQPDLKDFNLDIFYGNEVNIGKSLISQLLFP